MRSRTLLSEAARPFGVDCARLREVADIGAGDEGLVARSRQDDAAHGRIILRILEGGPQVLPCRRIEGVQHFGPVDRHIGEGAPSSRRGHWQAPVLVVDETGGDGGTVAVTDDMLNCSCLTGGPARMCRPAGDVTRRH